MQEFLVYLIVALAAAYLVRMGLKTLRGKGCHCDSGGCGSTRGKAMDSNIIQISVNGSGNSAPGRAPR